MRMCQFGDMWTSVYDVDEWIVGRVGPFGEGFLE